MVLLLQLFDADALLHCSQVAELLAQLLLGLILKAISLKHVLAGGLGPCMHAVAC
jgi:hypothetical protein